MNYLYIFLGLFLQTTVWYLLSYIDYPQLGISRQRKKGGVCLLILSDMG